VPVALIVSATFADIVASVERLADSPLLPPEALRELVAILGELVTRQHSNLLALIALASLFVGVSAWRSRRQLG
jgi:hypothetical protein